MLQPAEWRAYYRALTRLGHKAVGTSGQLSRAYTAALRSRFADASRTRQLLAQLSPNTPAADAVIRARLDTTRTFVANAAAGAVRGRMQRKERESRKLESQILAFALSSLTTAATLPQTAPEPRSAKPPLELVLLQNLLTVDRALAESLAKSKYNPNKAGTQNASDSSAEPHPNIKGSRPRAGKSSYVNPGPLLFNSAVNELNQTMGMWI